MTATGYYDQKSFRPGGLGLVIALHAAAFAGLVLVKIDIVRTVVPQTDVFFVRNPPTPPDEPPPPPRREPPQQRSAFDAPVPIAPTRPQGPVVTGPPTPPMPPTNVAQNQTVLADATPDLPRVPVRTEAQFDPRYAGELQPPYPPHEQAAQRDGTVRVRLTIGADGRVKAIERISATSEAFWRATERHALAHWRFRPATLDGRAVETTKVMNIVFRIEA